MRAAGIVLGLLGAAFLCVACPVVGIPLVAFICYAASDKDQNPDG